MKDNKKIGLVIPVRYNSERLPGKVLTEIAGKKQIEWIIERASSCYYLDCIILAVSDRECIEIYNWFSRYSQKNLSRKVYLIEGRHDNLMTRTLKAIRAFELDIIVSASHDCTLIDPYLMCTLIDNLFEYKADYSVNCIPRSYPDGFDLQVHTKEIYERVNKIIPKWDDTNMYTAWNIWHWREKLNPKPKIINYQAQPHHYHPDWKVSLDAPEDKIFLEKLISKFKELKNPELTVPSYSDIMELLIKYPELLKINKKVKPTEIKMEEI